MTDCETVLNEFLRGFKTQFALKSESRTTCSLTFPFETPSGEAIHVYVENLGDQFVLSDEGETLGNVFMYNVKPDGEVQEYLELILKRYGLEHEGGAITKSIPRAEIGTGLLQYVNALQQAAGLEFRKKARRVQSFDVIVRWELKQRSVPYDAAWRPQLRYSLPIDFASLNHRAIFQALGTVETSASAIDGYLRGKLYAQLALLQAGKASSYERYLILDEETKWPREAFEMFKDSEASTLKWPSEIEAVEGILRNNAATAPGTLRSRT